MPINEYDDLLKESANTAPVDLPAPAPVNEYDDIAGSDRDALKASMYVSQGKDPGRQVEYENLSKEANLPVDFIERNYDLVKSKFAKKADPNVVYKNAPKSSTWLADPNNAALSSNDLDQIMAMEKESSSINKEDKGFFESVGNAATTGYHQLEVGYWQAALMTGKVDPVTGAKHLAEASRNYRKSSEQAPLAAKNFKKIMEEEYGDIDKAFNQVRTGYDDINKGNITEALKNFSVGGAKTIYETLDLIGSSVKNKEQATGLVYTSAEQFANSIPAIGLGVAGGALGGATTLGAGAFAGYQAGSFVGEAISEVASSIGEVAAKKGYNFEDEESIIKFYSDPVIKQEVMDAALRKGVTTAAVDTFFNFFAGKKFLKAVKKEGAGVAHIVKETAKDVGTQMAGEATSEYAGQVAREKGLEGASLGESIYEGVNALGSSIVSVPLGAAYRNVKDAAGGGPKESVPGEALPPKEPELRKVLDKDPIKASEQLVKKADEAINVEQKVSALKNIGDQVKQMENVNKVPGKVGELIKVMTDENDVKSVFFQTDDWIKYWQDKGLNPSEEIGKIVEDGVARLQEAQNNGHQLEIPLANFVEKVATTEHYNPLVETAAVEAGGMTFSEAQGVQDQLQGTLETLAQEATAPDKVQSEGAIIRSSVEKQLIDAGMNPKEARVNSKIVAERAISRGRVMNRSPLELFQEDNLMITKESESKGKTFFQKDMLPGFYSKLEKTITDKMGASANIDQVNGILKEIKPEERKWSGIDDFLKGKEKVSKQELQDYLRANQLQIEEVRKGGESKIDEDNTGSDIYGEDGEYYSIVKDEDGNELHNAGPFESEREAREDIDFFYQASNEQVEGGPTKFEKYILPGGENYREVLLTMPPVSVEPLVSYDEQKRYDELVIHKMTNQLTKKEQAEYDDLNRRINEDAKRDIEGNRSVFRSSHFDEENILAHTRLTDRVDESGDKVLFIEEIQSDWHQAGREKGYADSENKKFQDEFEKAKDDFSGYVSTLREKYGATFWNNISDSERSKYDELNNKIRELSDIEVSRGRPVPDAPFKKTWHEFTFKKILLEAAQKGYKKVAWTTGDQQAERYKNALLASVDKFEVKKNSDGTYDLDALNGSKSVKKESNIKSDRINDLVGKSLGNQLIEAANNSNGETSTLEGDSFNIGGEGMRGFYDKILVNFANSFAKKFNAKVQDATLPALSFEQVSRTGRQTGKQTVHSIDITPQLKEAALNEGFALFQGENDPRGKIIFGDSFVNIALLSKANRSTFLHETAHLYLAQMMNDFKVVSELQVKSALQTQFMEDANKILKWVGVEKFEDIKFEQHEQFARGFEAYLMEGKAPSKDLRRIFAHFRSWLLDVYKNMVALNVELSDDVREVFGRMLVVDDKIAQAKSDSNMDKFFNNLKELGVSDEQAAKYARLRDEHNIRATEILQGKVLDDWQRQKAKWYKERFEATRKQVTQEVNKIPVYAAVDAMRNANILGQDLALSKEAIIQALGKDAVKKLPKGIYTTDGGVHPDVVAGLFGFNSGAEMLDSMAKIMQSRQGLMSWEQIKKDLILSQSNQIMDKNYPSLINMEDNLKNEATKAVHNDMRADVLELEHAMLLSENPGFAKKIISKLIKRMPSKRFIKEEAEKTIGRRKVSELKPHLFRRAEVQASKDTGEFFDKGDVDQAIESKKRERLNFALFNAAVEAKENYVKQLTFFRKLYRKDEDIAKSRDVNYIDAARAVLANFGIGKTDKTAHDYLSNVKKYDPSSYENLIIQIESLPFKPKPLDQLTVDEFNQVSDLVASLYEMAKSSKEIEVGGQKFEIEKVAQDMSIEIGKLTPENKKKYNQTATDNDKFRTKLLSWKSRLLRMESWAHTMDLGDINGLFTKFIWQPINESVIKYRIDKEKYIKQYKGIVENFKHLFTPQEILAPELSVGGKQFLFKNKSELLGALLHTGNDSNKKKLLVGRGWGTVDDSGALDTRAWDKFIQRMIDEEIITKDDFDFVQSVWDLFEEMKPSAQKAHKKLYGHYFAEVTADPIVTPFGEYRGGYAPAVVDRSESFDQDLRMDKEALESQVDSFMFPSTGRGFTKSRVEQYAAPLVLDLNLVGGHIDKVSRFSNIQPAVTQVHRLITNNTLNESLNQYDPTIRKNLLMPFLDRAAKQTLEIPSGYDNKLVDDMFRGLRKRIGQSFMFGNVFNILQQGIGLSLAASKVKPSLIRNSMFRYLLAPKKTADAITEKSSFMNQRMKGQIHETINAIDKITVSRNKLDKVRDWTDANAYVGQTIFQNMMDSIVWPAAYDQAIQQGMDEGSAVRSADHVVRTTQGSMNPEDSATYEMGTPFERSFKQFYSYFSMLVNLKSSAFTKIIRESGLKKGKSDLFFQMLYLFAIPSIINTLLVKGAAGGIGADDDDEKMNELASTFFGDLARTEFASIPGGQLLTLGLNSLNDNHYDDRLSTNPTFSVIEGLVTGTAKTAKQLWEEEEINKKKAIRDSFTLFSLFTGVPITPLSKPIGYLSDVSEGEANPTGPIDFTRGLVTGRKGSE